MPRVSFRGLSGSSVLSACLGLASLFVLSLYAVSAGLPRNHPVTVRRRILAIVCVCSVAPAYLWAWSSADDDDAEPLLRILGIKLDGIRWAIVSPLLLVSLAYLGPLIHYATLKENPFSELFGGERRDIELRNYVVAPFAEEFVFRACLVPLLTPSLGELWTILLCPLFFGLAHLHHIVEWALNGEGTFTNVLIGLLVQAGYTSVFGAFSAFLFVRSGHLVSPVLAHTYCNVLGLPPLASIPSHSRPYTILGFYVFGLVTFLLLLFPMTSPTWFID